MGHIDCGVFTTANVMPSTYYFEYSNISYAVFPDIVDSLHEYVKNKSIDFVVYYTLNKLDELQEKETVLFNNYDLITYETQKFEGFDFWAYLFYKKDNNNTFE